MIVTAQWVKLNPCEVLYDGMAGDGKEERERIILGKIKVWLLETRDRATRTGRATGYNKGAGSKL